MTHKLTIRLPKKLAMNISLLSEELGLSNSEMIRPSILKYVVSSNNLKSINGFSFYKDEIVRRTVNVNDTVHRVLKRLGKNMIYLHFCIQCQKFQNADYFLLQA